MQSKGKQNRKGDNARKENEMEKVLYLEKRGCDFYKDAEMEQFSDCGNYRLCGWIVDRNGRDLFVEFTRGDARRYTNKRTGAELKKPVIDHRHKLYIWTQYDNFNGSFGDGKMEREINALPLEYNTTDILKAVAILAGNDSYKYIVICDELPKIFAEFASVTAEQLQHLEKIAGATVAELKAAGGWRERNALENLTAYNYNKRDKVITLYYDNFCAKACSVDWSVDRRCYVG